MTWDEAAVAALFERANRARQETIELRQMSRVLHAIHEQTAAFGAGLTPEEAPIEQAENPPIP